MYGRWRLIKNDYNIKNLGNYIFLPITLVFPKTGKNMAPYFDY